MPSPFSTSSAHRRDADHRLAEPPPSPPASPSIARALSDDATESHISEEPPLQHPAPADARAKLQSSAGLPTAMPQSSSSSSSTTTTTTTATAAATPTTTSSLSSVSSSPPASALASEASSELASIPSLALPCSPVTPFSNETPAPSASSCPPDAVLLSVVEPRQPIFARHASSSDDPEAAASSVATCAEDDCVLRAGPEIQERMSPSKLEEGVANREAGTTVNLQDGAEDECIVCFMPLSDEPVQELACRHRFHATCIREWLRKDGRCPVCRHIEDEAAAAAAQSRSRRTIDVPTFADWTGRTSLLTTRLVLAEARRLLALASVEAAMSALVMSYVGQRDVLSPVLMFITAMVMIVAGSRFHLRAAAVCRPLLAFNIIYHIFMCMDIMQEYENVDLFSRASAGLRAAIVTLICVVVLEVVSLKSAGIFHLRLLSCSPVQLAALRRLRRPHDGWQQRLMLFALFLLIFAPVLIRSICVTWREMALPGEEVCRTESGWLSPFERNSTLPLNITSNATVLLNRTSAQWARNAP